MNTNSHTLLLIMVLLIAGTSARADCDPQSGFELGLRGEAKATGCEQRDYRMAAELGRQIYLLRREKSDLTDQVPEVGDQAAPALAARLRVIERELTQLEGMARIQGLLAAGP